MPGGTYKDNWDLFQPTFANKFAYFITFLGEKKQNFALYSLAIFYATAGQSCELKNTNLGPA